MIGIIIGSTILFLVVSFIYWVISTRPSRILRTAKTLMLFKTVDKNPVKVHAMNKALQSDTPIGRSFWEQVVLKIEELEERDRLLNNIKDDE